MFTGIAKPLEKEICLLASNGITVKVNTPPETIHSVWFGGSILSSLSTFEEICIEKDNYGENGLSIMQGKSVHST